VRVLLDTHALLWFLLADRQLSQRARALISDAETIVDIPAEHTPEVQAQLDALIQTREREDGIGLKGLLGPALELQGAAWRHGCA
jgi:hypothetical protein